MPRIESLMCSMTRSVEACCASHDFRFIAMISLLFFEMRREISPARQRVGAGGS
jgi:hypothetical protein